MMNEDGFLVSHYLPLPPFLLSPFGFKLRTEDETRIHSFPSSSLCISRSYTKCKDKRDEDEEIMNLFLFHIVSPRIILGSDFEESYLEVIESPKDGSGDCQEAYSEV